MIKKILKFTLISLITLSVLFAPKLSFAQNADDFRFPYPEGSIVTDVPTCVDEDCTDFVYEIPVADDDESIISQLLSVFGLNNSALSGDHKFIKYVRGILNMALGILSMVALVMTIYTFYMMFFSDNEAGAKKAKGNLIGIFIALAIIGLAWLIVSFIFRRYQSHWQTALG